MVRWVSTKIIDYGFVGGWGIRYGSKHGVVYNTSGRIGIAIKTRKGEKLVIGTKKQNKLKQVVNKLKKDSK